MRSRITVVLAALIAAAALVALPGSVGSRSPTPIAPLDGTAFVPLAPRVVLSTPGTATALEPDPAWRSAGDVEPGAAFSEPGSLEFPTARPRIDQPAAPVRTVLKPVPRVARPVVVAFSGGWRWDPAASFYGPGFYGGRTACGQAYTKTIVGVAHRTLPCGTRVAFRNPANGRVVVTQVIDRGPYVSGRTWDLSGALCRKLDHCYTGPIQWRYVTG